MAAHQEASEQLVAVRTEEQNWARVTMSLSSRGLLIDGEPVSAMSKKKFPVFSPLTDAVITHIPDGGPEDVDRAIGAADRAFPDWSATPSFERGLGSSSRECPLAAGSHRASAARGYRGAALLLAGEGSPRDAVTPVSERTESTAPLGWFTAQDRKVLIALVSVLVVVFALVGSNVAANHAPKPHHLPVGVIGTPSVVRSVAGSLEQRAPGAYEIRAYTSLAAARAAILHRTVYGALRPGPTPLLLVASAASPSVAELLEQTFAAPAQTEGNAPVVRDLVPLPSSDSRGATAFSMLLSLIIAGIMGSSVIYLLGRHRSPPVRLVAMVALGILAGLVATLATNVVVGAFHGHFLAIWGVAALFVIALGLPIAAFQVLVGAPGIAIGAVMFLVIGNPASGGSSAPELLPAFWRDLSQLLPPGAAITAMHDVVYFHGHAMTRALLVLGIYAILGATVVVTVHMLRARARTPTAPV